jgi:hypothetical protein
LTTVRRAEGVAKKEELAVKRPVPPLFWRLSEGMPPLPQKARKAKLLILSQLIKIPYPKQGTGLCVKF